MRAWFQALFHPPLGVLFTFPSRYCFPIGHHSSLALEGGPPCFPQAFSWLVVLRCQLTRMQSLPLRDSHPLRSSVPARLSAPPLWISTGPTTPTILPNGWFRLFPVRSPLLRESRLISFRQATEMFQFAHRPLLTYAFSEQSPDITLEGLPHSDSQGSSLAGSSP